MRYSLVKVLLTVSPFRPFLLPQPSVYSQLPVALQPNFYASGASSFLSITCRLLVALCAFFRARFVYFQQVADSFCKMPGVGMPLASRPPLPLPTLRPLCLCGEFDPNSFRCHTYKKRARNSFGCHTYKIALPQVLCLPHIRKNRGVGVCYG